MLTTASGEGVKIKHLHLEIEFRSAKDNNGKDLLRGENTNSY